MALTTKEHYSELALTIEANEKEVKQIVKKVINDVVEVEKEVEKKEIEKKEVEREVEEKVEKKKVEKAEQKKRDTVDNIDSSGNVVVSHFLGAGTSTIGKDLTILEGSDILITGNLAIGGNLTILGDSNLEVTGSLVCGTLSTLEYTSIVAKSLIVSGGAIIRGKSRFGKMRVEGIVLVHPFGRLVVTDDAILKGVHLFGHTSIECKGTLEIPNSLVMDDTSSLEVGTLKASYFEFGESCRGDIGSLEADKVRIGSLSRLKINTECVSNELELGPKSNLNSNGLIVKHLVMRTDSDLKTEASVISTNGIDVGVGAKLDIGGSLTSSVVLSACHSSVRVKGETMLEAINLVHSSWAVGELKVTSGVTVTACSSLSVRGELVSFGPLSVSNMSGVHVSRWAHAPELYIFSHSIVEVKERLNVSGKLVRVSSSKLFLDSDLISEADIQLGFGSNVLVKGSLEAKDGVKVSPVAIPKETRLISGSKTGRTIKVKVHKDLILPDEETLYLLNDHSQVTVLGSTQYQGQVD